MYSQNDLQPVNRNYVYFGGCLTIIFSFFIVSLAFRALPKPVPAPSPTKPFQTLTTEPVSTIDLSRYDNDSDQDSIPNFIEEKLNYNPFQSEIDLCSIQNPICSSSPFDQKIRVIFLVDASTSMNILAAEKSKLDTIKKDLADLIEIDMKDRKNFLYEIYSYGNQGSKSFIPDSESCISYVKQYDSSIREKVGDLPLLVPNGKSPLSYSLREISNRYNQEIPNIVIVIADSLDDCNGSLSQTLDEVLSKGGIQRVHSIAYLATEEANINLKNITESKGGLFVKDTNVRSAFKNFIRDDLYQNWCYLADYNNLVSCVEQRIAKPIYSLNEIKNIQETPGPEIARINFIIGKINLESQRFLMNQKNLMNEKFEEFLKTWK